MEQQAGLLITFEGIGGGGKSTAVEIINGWLAASGVPVEKTKEPGGTPLGRRLRSMLVDDGLSEISPLSASEQPQGWTEAFLFEADRSHTYQKVILPALQQGRCVIADRNFFGTYAYQGFGNGLDLDVITTMSAIATHGILPNLIFLFDIDPILGMSRKQAQGQADQFDLKDQLYQQRVREGYLRAAQVYEAITVIINASLSLEEVVSTIKTTIIERCGERYPNLRNYR